METDRFPFPPLLREPIVVESLRVLALTYTHRFAAVPAVRIRNWLFASVVEPSAAPVIFWKRVVDAVPKLLSGVP